MKKVLSILLCILLLTGCSNNLNLKSYDSIFDTFLSSESSLVNFNSSGYKYYLPTGVKVLESNDYNDKLYFNGYNYYLYIDIISYYNEINVDYNVDNSLFYSKKLDYNGKNGYVEISKIDDLYKVTMYYNYAKMEGYTSLDDIGSTLVNMCYILNSIKFNRSVIELSISDDVTNSEEEVYNFYKPKEKTGNFIDYVNQFGEYKEEVNENNIGNEGN